MQAETYRGTVYTWHCDFNNHMNVMHYVGMFDQATWHFFASLGITPDYLRSNNKGMFAVEQHIKYLKELQAGDLVHIQTELLEMKPKIIIFKHYMYNSSTQDVAAETRLVGAHVDQTLRKTVLFPEDILNNAAKILKQ
ncbi:MAG: acyl-CoA thioesterase [Aureispira sp.]|nr:acyl-CoA thioesterase [Aureispira sp.]